MFFLFFSMVKTKNFAKGGHGRFVKICKTSHCLADLQPCSTMDLERIIRSSPAKSCDLDPIPTFLLREFLDDLLPYIHTMCNTSLSTGVLPSSQKRAIVTRRLKRKEMDLNERISF